PWTARPLINTSDEVARPLASDAAENRTRPAMKTRLRPRMSPARPPSSKKPPRVNEYALITHCRFEADRLSPRSIDGRATFTIVASNTTMNCAKQTTTSTAQGPAVRSLALLRTASFPALTGDSGTRFRTRSAPASRLCQCRSVRRPLRLPQRVGACLSQRLHSAEGHVSSITQTEFT